MLDFLNFELFGNMIKLTQTKHTKHLVTVVVGLSVCTDADNVLVRSQGKSGLF